MTRATATFAAVLALALAAPAASAQPAPDYGAWPVLVNPFPSTGGGGVMIDDYRPVVTGDLCLTAFTAIVDGQRFANLVAFDAVPTQGGVLCTRGRWASVDGSAAGTTPFEVFLRDGVVRRMP
jgi:hypothetical protein